jgi:hypothetical protein
LRRGLASLAIGYNLIRDLLPLVETVHSGPLDSTDVHKHILASIIRLNEAEALLAVKPLHGSCGHVRYLPLTGILVAAREHRRFAIGFWEKVVSEAAFAPEANSFGRNSIDIYSAFEQFSKVTDMQNLEERKHQEYRRTTLPSRPRRLNVPIDAGSTRSVDLLVGNPDPQAYHGIGTMPLARSKEQILITMNGVRFLMADGATEVPCRAARELLEDRFGSNGDQAEDEKAFRMHRAAIEQAASDKYDAGQVEPVADPKIVVTAWDMASPLSRKM